MKIYLIDDTSNQFRETNGFPDEKWMNSNLGNIQFVSIRTSEEASAIFDQLDDSSCVIYHKGLSGGGKVVTTLGQKYQKRKIQNLLAISEGADTVGRFSKNRGEMKKSLFYGSLKGFLVRCRAEGDVTEEILCDLVAGRLKGSQEAVPETETEEPEVFVFEYKEPTPSVPSPEWIKATDEFLSKKKEEFNGLDPKTMSAVVAFDLDKMTPFAVRRAALYIRLALRKSGRIGFLPFIFYGMESREKYLSDFIGNDVPENNVAPDILFAEGSLLIGGVEDIYSALEKVEKLPASLTPENYRRAFLDRVKVVPNDEKAGNHSIANYWGAYILGNAIAGAVKENKKKKELGAMLEKVVDKREPLYLYYLTAQGLSKEDLKGYYDDQISERLSVEKLPTKGRRILYIDDQNDIWEPVILGLFSDAARVDVIGKDRLEKSLKTDNWDGIFKGYPVSYDLESYDLILLDLRLKGDAEEGEVGENISGLKVLQYMMDLNRGLRVIMFTSSNKAWNLGLAIEHGAVGYYMKESPEIGITSEETSRSVKDFLNLIEKCFQGDYLRGMVKKLKTLREDISAKWVENTPERVQDVLHQLEIALNMVFLAERTEKQEDYEYAYIALEQVFEIIKLEDTIYELYRDIPVYEAVENASGVCVSYYTGLRNKLIHDKKAINLKEVNVKEKVKELWDVVMKVIRNTYKIHTYEAD